jgi:hypothetical protein
MESLWKFLGYKEEAQKPVDNSSRDYDAFKRLE